MMDISIIIPVGTAHRDMATRAIDSCFAGTASPTEVIVVEDGPQVGMQERDDIRLIRLTEKMGRSTARNRAIYAAQTAWLFFLDADDTLEPEALEDIETAIADGAWIVYADYWYRENGSRIQCRKMQWSPFRLEYNALNIGMAVMTNRARAIGGFDEDMTHAEYWDFFLRYVSDPNVRVVKATRPLFEAGAGTSCDPKATVNLDIGMLKVRAMVRGGYYKTKQKTTGGAKCRIRYGARGGS